MPDRPVIAGSPVCAGIAGEARPTAEGGTAGDAEVLGFVIAVNDNEILAAAEAAKEEDGPTGRGIRRDAPS